MNRGLTELGLTEKELRAAEAMADIQIQQESVRLNNESQIVINFIDEDGEVLQLKTTKNERTFDVFTRYASQQGTPYLLSGIMCDFKYNGKLIPLNVTIRDVGIVASSDENNINNAIIYVTTKLPSKSDFDSRIIPNISTIVKNKPRFFIDEKVPINDITGTITEYDEENGLFIIGCYTIDKTYQYDMDQFITLLQDYYSNLNGFYQDYRLYLLVLELKYEDQVEQLDTNHLDEPNAIILQIIKIRQQIYRLLSFINRAVTRKEEWGVVEKNMFNYFSGKLREVLSSLADKKKSLLSNSSIHKVNKPLLESEEEVWVKRWPNNDKTLQHSWERGTVRSYTEHKDIDGYGPRRVYSVELIAGKDSGDLLVHIEDYHVIPEANFSQEYDLESIGVNHVFDKDSSDQWAREIGWHTVEIDGSEETFVYMSDAIEAINLKNEAATYIEQQSPKTTIYQEFGVEFCMLQSIGRLSDPIMRRIGRILLLFVLSGVEHDGVYWKAAQGHYTDRHTTQMKDSLYKFALSKQCKAFDSEPSVSVPQICRFFISSEGCLDTFLLKVPIFREGYDSTVSKHKKDLLSGHNSVSPDPEMMMTWMMAYLKKNEPENSDRFLNVRIITGHETERYNVECDAPFKQLLAKCADDRHTSIKSLRIKHNERTLFISGIGKKTLEELGIQDYDTIEVTILQTTNETTSNEPLKQPSPKGKNKKRNNKKKHKKSNKRRPVQVAPPEDLKGEHSKLLGKVYEEAEPTFKEIRQRLNAMNLERTKPKQRTSPTKASKPVEVVDNPLDDDQLGGKAGKTQFIIQVGEVSNLYKTTKPSSASRGRRQDDIMIDLHGLTAEEAVYRLDDSLPNWIENAMKGTYPFVIPVKIVCGGGSQILAEVVENWIKQNDNVANAPKNMYS